MIIIPTEKRFDLSRAPIVLFCLVILNVVVFFAYQSGDDSKFEKAFESYAPDVYLAADWPAFIHYSTQAIIKVEEPPVEGEPAPQAASSFKPSTQRLVKLEQVQKVYEKGDLFHLSYLLLADKGFQVFLQETYADTNYIKPQLLNATRQGAWELGQIPQDLNYDTSYSHAYSGADEMDFNELALREESLLLTDNWLKTRQQAHQIIRTTSNLKFGLIPADLFDSVLSVTSLVTYQFLHGGIMHLMGNLFFLIICGFAVEAAIGHLKFLLFYLASGTAGGLLHFAFSLDSYVPLVGASGAVSGVMAMYLAVFKLRKIEFFYWFFAFVGYFRAPALFILPVYIANELVQYFMEDNSSTAFMAHVGGFVLGGVLITISQYLKPAAIDMDYVEEDQSISAEQLSLAEIYAALENYQFVRALKLLPEHMQSYGSDIELDYMYFNLLIKENPKQAAKTALAILKSRSIEAKYLNKICRLLDAYPVLRKHLSIQELAQLGMQFVDGEAAMDKINYAESLFNDALNKQKSQSDRSVANQLPLLARHLAKAFAEVNNEKKRQVYLSYADNLLAES
ncbi:rhomboid family intramembrane serine protease [Agaribacterium sp. ZY112]|uniref:rhomboid family intramembrane serine protease n=1 Tax=Agaribacterium sp. ZY112 TaxID=3233574 RepID=UPI003524A839